MIKITYNNELYQLSQGSTLTDFIALLNVELTGAAVAINQRFIPRAGYKATLLQDNDVLELIIPMQGG